MPKQSSEMATTAKGSGGSQIGTLRNIEGPEDRCNHRCDCHTKKDSKARFGCLRQATPHKPGTGEDRLFAAMLP